MTIGDVLAVVAGVFAFSGSLWGLLVGVCVLFGERAERAREALEARPLRVLGGGTAVAATAGGIGLILLNQPNGLLKFVGWVLLLGLLAVAALGGGGLALVVRGRLLRMEPHLSPLGALGRGSALLVVAGFVPLLGWFGVAPLATLAALGAGLQALRRGTTAAAQDDGPGRLGAPAGPVPGALLP